MPRVGVDGTLDILVLSPWLPWPPHDGARIRILETIRFLSARHRVFLMTSLYTPEERDHVAAVRELCAGIETIIVPDGATARLRRLVKGLWAGLPAVQAYHRNDEMVRRIRSITAETPFDIVHVELSLLGHYLAALRPGHRTKRILSMHNIESVRFERELALAPWNARRLALSLDRYWFRSWEQRVVRSFDGIVAVSDIDKQWIERHASARPVALVTNGVNVDYFRPQIASNATALVFTGTMNYPPNVDAVLWFAREILPRLRQRLPELGFTIVGGKPLAEVEGLTRVTGVQVTGRVDDIRPYLADALAVVVPLRSGGGTRLKILEAMAMARPVVSTTLGAEGLEVTHGHDILIADRPEQFVESVLALASSRNLASRIGQAGRELAVARYDWRQCLLGLEDLYRTVLAGEPPKHRLPKQLA
jgi:sugar transferase (PEP-CTERM/EpsH1 system associated)